MTQTPGWHIQNRYHDRTYGTGMEDYLRGALRTITANNDREGLSLHDRERPSLSRTDKNHYSQNQADYVGSGVTRE